MSDLLLSDLPARLDAKIIYYEAPVRVVRDRLDILGYDVTTAKEAFWSWITEERNVTLERARNLRVKDPDTLELLASAYRRDIDILALLTPEAWIEKLREIQACV